MNPESQSQGASRRRSWQILLALIFFAALAIRALAALKRPMIELDEAVYARMAENLAAGKGPLDLMEFSRVFFSPLYPLFVAGVAVVFRSYVLSGYIVAVVFGSLMVIPTFLLGREFVNERAGLMAAALLAVFPIFVDYSSKLYNESVYIFFLLFGIYFGWHLLKNRRMTCGIMAGVSIGFAYLTNPTSVYYVVIIAGLAVVITFFRGGWGTMLKSVSMLLVFFLIVAAPYLIFLHSEMGKWSFTGKDITPAIHYYSAVHGLRYNTVEWEKDLYSLTNDGQEVRILRLDELPGINDRSVIRHPLTYIKIFANQTNIFYTQELVQVFPLWLLPLLGLGLFARGWDRRRAVKVGFLLLMMVPALVIMAMYAHSRFFMPFVPLAIIWVAQGWQKLEEWGSDTITHSLAGPHEALWRRWAPWLIGTAVLLPLLIMSGVTVARQSYPVEYKEAGQWLRQEAGPGSRVMSRDSSVAYYSGGVSVILPYADYESTTHYARLKNVDYLVMADWDINNSRPDLAVLMQDDSQHPDWRLIDRIRPGTGQETLVFQLVK
ncbi:MAG: glycosyltransferase family 39 protein [Actinobacteria bacterium]|nr:glycosyltransferase family 39 protein [Actinomycetota bacterium]